MHRRNGFLQLLREAQQQFQNHIYKSELAAGPIEMGGWVFVGAVGDFYKGWTKVLPLLNLYMPEEGQPNVAVVETLFYISVCSLVNSV